MVTEYRGHAEARDANLGAVEGNGQQTVEGMASMSLDAVAHMEDGRPVVVHSMADSHIAYVEGMHAEAVDTAAATAMVAAGKEDSLRKAAEVVELESLGLELMWRTVSGLDTGP